MALTAALGASPPTWTLYNVSPMPKTKIKKLTGPRFPSPGPVRCGLSDGGMVECERQEVLQSLQDVGGSESKSPLQRLPKKRKGSAVLLWASGLPLQPFSYVFRPSAWQRGKPWRCAARPCCVYPCCVPHVCRHVGCSILVCGDVVRSVFCLKPTRWLCPRHEVLFAPRLVSDGSRT